MTIQQLSKSGIAPTWDLALVFFLFILVLFYEVSSGKSRFLLTLLSTYFAYVVVGFFPFWNWVQQTFALREIFYLQIAFFGGLIFIFSFLLVHSVLGSFFSFAKQKFGHFLQIFFFSILQTGLLTSCSFSFLPEQYYNFLSPLTLNLFLEDFAQFFWILLPIIALIVVRKKKEPLKKSSGG